MTPFEEAMAAPRIEVIDAAIARIENGQEVFTCLALREAVGIVFPGLPPEEAFGVWSRYCRQYALSCKSNGAQPWWWNSQAPLRSHRIAALKNFRQLCLDAAK